MSPNLKVCITTSQKEEQIKAPAIQMLFPVLFLFSSHVYNFQRNLNHFKVLLQRSKWTHLDSKWLTHGRASPFCQFLEFQGTDKWGKHRFLKQPWHTLLGSHKKNVPSLLKVKNDITWKHLLDTQKVHSCIYTILLHPPCHILVATFICVWDA